MLAQGGHEFGTPVQDLDRGVDADIGQILADGLDDGYVVQVATATGLQGNVKAYAVIAARETRFVEQLLGQFRIKGVGLQVPDCYWAG